MYYKGHTPHSAEMPAISQSDLGGYTMKRVLALILAAVTVACCFTSCSTLAKGDKGAIITVYLADELYDFDPTQSYTNDALAQITTLMFEGLTTLNEKGDWEKGMMKKYETLEDEDGNVRLRIELRESKWSDGRPVQANDFVYAWKRLLEPTFSSDAACLLYDIKNARAIKMGDQTVDDLGVYAVETYVLEIEFEHNVDVDLFLRTLASPALVPLREDKVGSSEDWARRSSSMVTNGPFDVRKIVFGQELRLERSSYYYRDTESNQALDKYVIPYRLYIKYGLGDEAAQLNAYENVTDTNQVFYLGDIALASREAYKESAEITNNLNTYSYYFNTEVEPFDDARVRRALSLALDREAMAQAVVYADAATGLIPAGIADTKVKEDFREKGGNILATSANVAEAKKLLSEAGVSGGSFTLTVRDDEVDLALANLAKQAWSQLGFTVKVESDLGVERIPSKVQNESDVYIENFQTAFETGDFEVIGIDSQMLTNDAYAALAPFAPKFSGNGVDMVNDYAVNSHITGYNSEDYNALMEQIYNTTDLAERSNLLHQAESKLLEDMPVIPVVFLKNGHTVNKDILSGFKTTFWGTANFKRVKMKDYMTYKTAIEASEVA